MTFLPINLGVRRTPDTEKGALKGSQLKTQTEKILKRDDYTCRFCGFRSKQYQRVIPYADKKEEHVTACSFCEQCLLLERAGMMGTGVLIWLPEISQAELNHMARAIYVARSTDDPLAAQATRALDALMARRADAKKRLGSDDPLLLATVMHESLTDEELRKANDKLDGIKLMPLDKHVVRGPKGEVNQFPQVVKYWSSGDGPFARYPVEQWAEMFKNASSSVGNA